MAGSWPRPCSSTPSSRARRDRTGSAGSRWARCWPQPGASSSPSRTSAADGDRAYLSAHFGLLGRGRALVLICGCRRAILMRSPSSWSWAWAGQPHGLAPVLVTWAGFLSLAVVLVVTAPPVAGFIAAEWRPVEPLVHAPEAVEPARVRGVGVVDDAIFEGERAHAGTFSPVRLPVRSDDARCELVEPGAVITGWRAQVRRAEVVLDGAGLPLLLGVRGLEVVVEVGAEGRRPGEAPVHPPLVRLQFRERGPRHRAERDVVIREMDDRAIEAISDRRAGRAPCGVVGSEHEVIDEQLRASAEEISEGGCAGVGFEAVLLFDSDPRQLLALPRHFVATSGQRLLGLEQLQPGCQPLFACSGRVMGHLFLSFKWVQLLTSVASGRGPMRAR